MESIYLDNNATTRPLPEVREAVLRAMEDLLGNPSSPHESGEAAHSAVQTARAEMADLVGADPEQVCFTSSCTEANNIVLQSALHWNSRAPRVLTTVVEHASVLRTVAALEMRGLEVHLLPVDRDGRISLSRLEDALKQGARLVSIQWVNNETGVVQEIRGISELCRRYGVPLHTDAAQAVGKMDVNFGDASVDYLTFSGHKFHAPLGTGGIVARSLKSLHAISYGGEQEFGLRAGTENVPALVGLGTAARSRKIDLVRIVSRLKTLRDLLEERIMALVPSVRINGSRSSRVVNCTNLCFPKVDGQALATQLDLRGIRCSQSSACTTARPEPSHVLRAMGLTEDEAYSSIRFSVSVDNTEDEVEFVARAVAEIHQRLEAFSGHGRREPAVRAARK